MKKFTGLRANLYSLAAEVICLARSQNTTSKKELSEKITFGACALLPKRLAPCYIRKLLVSLPALVIWLCPSPTQIIAHFALFALNFLHDSAKR